MSPTRAAVIAAVVGFAVMSVELTAVRIMAPHFGDSAYVWTNVIGVILVALALGAFLGGRAAASGDHHKRLSTVLLVGGVWTAIVPWLVDPAGSWLVPDDIALDQAMGVIVRGSLAASTVLFAPAVLFAGMATPLLVTTLVDAGRRVGHASGHVAAWSTLGSLAGTFATTHALVPGIGSQLTILTCAGLFAVAGFAARFVPARAAALLPVVIGFALLGGTRTSVRQGEVLLAEVESSMQFLRVIRSGDPTQPPELEEVVTRLEINEGLDSFHSVKIEGTAFTNGRYYDAFVATPYLRGDGVVPEEFSVLSIGAAAGTFERVLSACVPHATFDSVELDPAVVELAREFFGGFPATARVFAGVDGRVFVDRARDSYDVVIVDAYERQIYIPAHVASREFFTAVLDRLEDGGVVAVNAGGRSFDDPVVEVVSATIAAVFGEAVVFRVPNSRNFMVLGRKGKPVDFEQLTEITPPRAPTLVFRDLQTAGLWRRVAAGGPVLSDDKPFLDRVQDESLARSMQDPSLIVMNGSVAVEAAEQVAYDALIARDLSGLRRALADAQRPSSRLRLYAGDLRWMEHDLIGARAEYAAGCESLAGQPDDVTSETLRARLSGATEEVDRLSVAAGVATRNGWMAVIAGFVLLAAFAVTRQRLPATA